MISALLRLALALLGLAVVGLLAAGSWLGYQTFYAKDRQLRLKEAELAQQRERIGSLEAELQAKTRQIERLTTAVRLLKTDHRVAYLDVIDQRRGGQDDRLQTKIAFVEVDDSGQPLDQPKPFTIDGDLVYVDYWVIKFDDDLVERGDPLRSTSLALFRRLFGEFQEPNEGFVLDQPGTRPVAYGKGSQSTNLERELWSNFWQYATDAQKAKAAGVRAAHGEAASTKLLPGKRYRILLRSSGGLSITPEDQPPATDKRAA